MNIFINPQSDKGAPVLQAKPSGSPISQLRFKRGSSVPLTVTLLGVTEAGNLRIGMKRRDRYESPLLVYATAAEPDEAEGSATETAPCGVRFTLMLHVNSEELDDALGVGAGDSVDVPGAVAALTEVCWEEGETTRISDSVPTVIANDIVRMNEDTPQSEQGAYPLPELLATKGWVNDLHAGAGQYGLVELESGTTLQDGHYTAVALTAGGAIGVPRATASVHGTVKLGTSRALSDTTGVLPVGARTSDGALAVDATDLSAYALAKANGFSGTEEQWLASLKGEKGDKGDTGDVGPQGAPETMLRTTEAQQGAGNVLWNYAVLDASLALPGFLKKVEMKCRSTGNPAGAFYLGVYQQPLGGGNDPSAWTFLGASTNSVTQSNNAWVEWAFPEGLELAAGRPIALMSMASATAGWTMDTQIGGRSSARAGGDGTTRMVSTRATLNEVPELRMTVQMPLGSELVLHEQDATAHVTAAERAAWNGKADASALTAHTGSSTLHLTAGQRIVLTNAAGAIAATDDLKKFRIVWFRSRTQPGAAMTVEAATGSAPEVFMEAAASAYAEGGAFVVPLGDYALLVYRGTYTWDGDNDFATTVWGALASEDNAGEMLYKEL